MPEITRAEVRWLCSELEQQNISIKRPQLGQELSSRTRRLRSACARSAGLSAVSQVARESVAAIRCGDGREVGVGKHVLAVGGGERDVAGDTERERERDHERSVAEAGGHEARGGGPTEAPAR